MMTKDLKDFLLESDYQIVSKMNIDLYSQKCLVENSCGHIFSAIIFDRKIIFKNKTKTRLFFNMERIIIKMETLPEIKKQFEIKLNNSRFLILLRNSDQQSILKSPFDQFFK